MMQKTKSIWYNGHFVPWDEAKVHVLSHTLHYGGGAFEGIRVYKTEKGPAIFRLKEHIDRFFYSAAALKMSIAVTKKELHQVIIQLIKNNNLMEGYIRPLAFYGYGNLHLDPTGLSTEIAIACWPWGPYLPHESIDIKTSQYIRIHPDSTITDAKICGHYVNSILAALELQGSHYHEALFLTTEGYIAEGTGENFFMLKDKQLFTPKLGSILDGITRDTVIKIAQSLKLQVNECNLKLDDAYHADELFLTGTAAEITPIRSIDDKLVDAHGHKLTYQIKEAYLDIVHGRNENYFDYLTFVE